MNRPTEGRNEQRPVGTGRVRSLVAKYSEQYALDCARPWCTPADIRTRYERSRSELNVRDLRASGTVGESVMCKELERRKQQ
jgi:hypothetical protein